jgi:hypothetical protein
LCALGTHLFPPLISLLLDLLNTRSNDKKETGKVKIQDCVY